MKLRELSPIEYDTVYTYDLTGKVRFWDLEEEDLYELFRDGRTSSRFLERQVPKMFAQFEYVDGKGYDWIREQLKKVEGKCYTKGGCNFAPSAMVGSGRKVVPSEVKEHIEECDLDYIIMDIVEFPTVHFRFIKGKDLIETHPNCKITNAKKWRKKYFGV
jgi:hypothetical protein|tara:strand:+ start:807 stop:1286 length:480 start_codon:yes stop_codon:yes gene_type:complete